MRRSKKLCKTQARSFKRGYLINGNENMTEK